MPFQTYVSDYSLITGIRTSNFQVRAKMAQATRKFATYELHYINFELRLSIVGKSLCRQTVSIPPVAINDSPHMFCKIQR